MTDTSRPPRRREDLPPMLRAVSDTLDDFNNHMHGLTSSWAHPAEFLEVLAENGYAVVGTTELETIRAAIARARRLAEQWSAWTPQDGDCGTLSTAGRALTTALDPPPPGEFIVEVMTSWAPYAPEIVAEMTGGDEAELRRTYGDTIKVRMGLGGPVELRWGGPGPNPADVEETRHIVRDHILWAWADRARGSAGTRQPLTLSQQGLTPTLRPALPEAKTGAGEPRLFGAEIYSILLALDLTDTVTNINSTPDLLPVGEARYAMLHLAARTTEDTITRLVDAFHDRDWVTSVPTTNTKIHVADRGATREGTTP